MAAITQTCSKCSKQFLVIDQEQQFLREKSLPIPIHCPECRQARRLELRGGRKLYRAKCSKCGKDIVTAYDPETATSPILCRDDYNKWNAESDLMISDPLPDAPGQQATTLIQQPATQSQTAPSAPVVETTPQPTLGSEKIVPGSGLVPPLGGTVVMETTDSNKSTT